MINDEPILAIIPARGGSKRIPKKNIKLFLGKPIISYSINAALQSNLFDEVIVSTDDEEIALLSKNLGANVPFKRSKINSNDYSSTADVIEEVLTKYRKMKPIDYKYFCCIYPTAPFLRKEKLHEALKLLINNNADCVLPVMKYSYPIQRSLKIRDNNLKMLWPENYNKRSQDLEEIYHDAGQLYFMRTSSFKKEKKLFVEKSIPLIIDQIQGHDIDNSIDWQVAEFKYKSNQKSKLTSDQNEI